MNIDTTDKQVPQSATQNEKEIKNHKDQNTCTGALTLGQKGQNVCWPHVSTANYHNYIINVRKKDWSDKVTDTRPLLYAFCYRCGEHN